MSVSLLRGKVAARLLFIQFLAVTASGVLFCLKDPFWGVSAWCGGLVVLLANMLFMVFVRRYPAQAPAKGRICWYFALGEAVKVVVIFSLLVVALAVFRMAFLPLTVTWVLALVVQILASAVINNKG